MPDHEDQQLVKRALAGDTLAFRDLVERHQGFAYRLAYRFVGTVSDAEDITQEAFIRLWKSLHRYRAEIKLTTWLYKIVTNLCLDFLKSRHNRTTRRIIDLTAYKGWSAASAADQSMLNEELRMAVEKLTAVLSPKQKAVFVLRDLEEVGMEEIAKILSMAPGQVKSNLYYARRKVSEMITAYYQIKKETKSSSVRTQKKKYIYTRNSVSESRKKLIII